MSKNPQPQKAKTFLDYRHPGWEMERHWRFLIETFEGGPKWLANNIQKFYKEGKKEFASRLERAYRDNISRDVIEIFTAYLFKPGITRDLSKASEGVKRFLDKATKGHDSGSLDLFMSRVADKTSAVSPCFVVVDMPAIPEHMRGAELTVAQAQEARLFPYVYVLYPTEVLDFAVDEDGEFLWVIVVEFVRDDADPIKSSREIKMQFRVWTRSDWRLFELDKKAAEGYKLIDQGSHPCKAVPVVRVVHKESGSVYTGISLIEEIAYKDRAIANNESRLDCIIADQTFSTLWIPDKGLVANTERDAEGKRQKMIQAATNRAALFNDGANHVPFFLAPDAAQAGVIDALIARLRGEIWEDALLSSQGKEKASGPMTATESEHEFDKLNGALGDKAAGLEAAERRIIKLVAAWLGEDIEEDSLAALSNYPRKFNIQAIIDELTELLQFKQFPGLNSSTTFWEKALDRIVSRYFGDGITEDEREQIKQEIQDNLSMNNLLMVAAVTEAGQTPPGQGQQKENPED